MSVGSDMRVTKKTTMTFVRVGQDTHIAPMEVIVLLKGRDKYNVKLLPKKWLELQEPAQTVGALPWEYSHLYLKGFLP